MNQFQNRYSAGDYASMIWQLFPKGLLWTQLRESATMQNLVDAFAQEPKRFSDAVEEIRNESFPEIADNLIPWADRTGVKQYDDETDEIYRKRIVMQTREQVDPTDAYLISYLAELGYTITIESPLPGKRIIHVQHSSPVVVFRAGVSRAGDKLVTYNAVQAVEDICTRLTPGHIDLSFTYLET